MQFAPSVAITQLLSALCILRGCEHRYPSPVEMVSPPQPLALGSEARSGSKIINSSVTKQTTNPSPSYTVVNPNGGRIVTRRSRLSEKKGKLNEVDNDDQMMPPLVITALGKVEGYHMRVVSGRLIYAFEGIPYAIPPVGTNRFQAPLPHSGWNATLDAKSPGAECIQLVFGRMKGSEDCLTVNVYTPKIQRGKSHPKLPVLIFIHGGFFLGGSGANYGPTYLLRENVVLVTFNYRVGIIGAFSTGDSIASGNWGLKDQALAITWVHKYISSFGGDPDHLILMGQSAGAVSTHLQMMSPLARDKLRAAIIISGSAYNCWGLNTLSEGLRVSRNTARLIRCPLNSGSPALLNCMQNISAEVLVANQIFTHPSGVLPIPMIEPNVAGAFLSQTPDSAYQAGNVAKIPLITTVTSEEINYFIAEVSVRRGIGLLNGIFDLDAPTVLSLRGKIPITSEFRVVSKIRRHYGIGPLRIRIPREFFSEVGNARYFTVPFHKTVQMHSQIAPTYPGIFNYTNNHLGKAVRLGLDPKEYGVTHTDDLFFIFNSTNKPAITQNDYGFALTKLLANLYANFGKTSVPSFTDDQGMQHKFWDVVKDPQNFQLLQIDEEVKMMDNPYAKSAKFWESLGIPDMTPYIKLKAST